LLQYPLALRGLGFVGSLILAWFGICAFRSKLTDVTDKDNKPSLLRYSAEGYLMTLINPGTILFWVSVSSQISMTAANNSSAIPLAGAGVMVGALGWVLFLNILLHFTRHRLSKKAMMWLNYLGGTILLIFAALGMLRAFQII
jgi:threonine/homoserine/homoserine lactone efflux protein